MTGAQSLNWNSATWQAVGGLFQIGVIEESSDSRGQALRIVLSGISTSVIATILSQNYRGRFIVVWRANLDYSTGALAGEPINMGSYLMNAPWEVAEDIDPRGVSTVRVSSRVVSRLTLFRDVNGIRTNLASHQRIAAGDTFFQNVAGLVGKKISWGRYYTEMKPTLKFGADQWPSKKAGTY